MEITHLGHSSFKIRGKQVTIVTDPYNSQMIGLKFPKVDADVVTISHEHGDHNFISAINGTPQVLAGPGEYEIRGAKIMGVASFHDSSGGSVRGKNTVYRINVDGVSIVHCGDLGHKFDDIQLETVSGANILMIPVGGFYTIDASVACEVVSQISPDIIIPMHYKVSELKSDIADKLTGVDVFLKQMGKEEIVAQPKLTITRDKLPSEPTVVVLQ